MSKIIPICQVHGDELRQEHSLDEDNRGVTTGYCSKCTKHYRLCMTTHYMDHCVRLVNHDGEHRGYWGSLWKGEYPNYKPAF